MPVVLYGLEYVNWNFKSMHKLIVFQNRMMRAITNRRLLDHTLIYELLRMTNQYLISSIICSKTIRSHKTNTNWTKQNMP